MFVATRGLLSRRNPRVGQLTSGLETSESHYAMVRAIASFGVPMSARPPQFGHRGNPSLAADIGTCTP